MKFAFFRIGFGFYLMVHFLYLIPYAKEVFSSEGMLPAASMNMTHGYFPSVLYISDSPLAVQAFVTLMALLSLALVLGWRRRLMCFLLWYGWACLYDRNNLIQTPALFYVGWLLLALAMVPEGEPRSFPFSKRNPDWKFPREIAWMAWWLLAFGYTLSGFHKFLNSPSWFSGDALSLVLQTPLASDGLLKSVFVQSPIWVQKGLTWWVLFLEMFFLPLCIFRRTIVQADHPSYKTNRAQLSAHYTHEVIDGLAASSSL